MESHDEQQQPREPNTIFVGKKPTMAYVLACLTQIQNGSEGITVKARGKAISRAVDVAQILTKRFATDIKVKSIQINTEQVKSNITGGMSNVSSIEIKLQK
jgi:DNA-binding protein